MGGSLRRGGAPAGLVFSAAQHATRADGRLSPEVSVRVLSLRVVRSCENARKIVLFLSEVGPVDVQSACAGLCVCRRACSGRVSGMSESVRETVDCRAQNVREGLPSRCDSGGTLPPTGQPFFFSSFFDSHFCK